METKKKSPLLRLWNMGKEEHGKLILAIVLAVIGVTCSMAAYYSAAQMIIGLLHGNQNISFYLTWCAIAFAGYVIKAVLYTLSTASPIFISIGIISKYPLPGNTLLTAGSESVASFP